jgi:hypothetical protein
VPDTATYEPTMEEVQQALERLRKQKAYRKTYAEKRKAELEQNPEKAAELAAKRKEYFEAHKDEIYARRSEYYEKNKDKIKEYHKKYQNKQKAILATLRDRAKEAGMSLEEYLESVA